MCKFVGRKNRSRGDHVDVSRMKCDAFRYSQRAAARSDLHSIRKSRRVPCMKDHISPWKSTISIRARTILGGWRSTKASPVSERVFSLKTTHHPQHWRDASQNTQMLQQALKAPYGKYCKRGTLLGFFLLEEGHVIIPIKRRISKEWKKY